MPNYIAGVDPFLNDDFTTENVLNSFMSPTTPSPTNVGRSRRGGMRPESRIVHASIDIAKKKRDEFSEIERICKYPYKDKQIEL